VSLRSFGCFPRACLLRGLSQTAGFRATRTCFRRQYRDDHQLQYLHACEVNLIVLNLACRLRGLKFHSAARFRESLDRLLSANEERIPACGALGLIKHQIDSPEPLRLIEDKTDGLRSRARSTPPLAISRRKRGLDRMAFVFRREFEVAAVSSSARLGRRPTATRK